MCIAKNYHLRVVEDACQAHGARYAGKMVGRLGDAGCFSFYPTKNLGAFGDAGIVVTNSERIAGKVRALRNYGEVVKYQNSCEDANSRLDELHTALLKWGVSHLEEWNSRRAESAEVYFQSLRNTQLQLPPESNGAFERVWHLFVVQCDRRNELQRYLGRLGIRMSIHYPTPIHRQRAYAFL